MDEDNFFANAQKLFKLYRMWSFHERENKTRLGRFLKWMIFISTGASLVIVTLSDAIEHMKHGEITIIFTKGLYFLGVSTAPHKMFAVIFNKDDIFTYINEIKRISSKFKNTSDIIQCLRLYHKLFSFSICIVTPSTALFMIAPLTTGEYRQLPFTPYLPYLNVVKTPNWHLLYIYEFLAAILVTTTMMAYDTLFCGIMSVCAGILSSVCREIREFEDIIEDHQTLEKKMIDTIVKLNEINQLTSSISDTFSMTTMTHIIYNCSTMALGLFMITSLSFDLQFVSMIMVIVLITFQLWIYCYFGQNLVNQREVLRRDLYFTRWYDASKNFKTMLLLTIREAQNDRYVYAGKIVPLSFETFTQVTKKAYAFFTFMNDSR